MLINHTGIPPKFEEDSLDSVWIRDLRRIYGGKLLLENLLFLSNFAVVTLILRRMGHSEAKVSRRVCHTSIQLRFTPP